MRFQEKLLFITVPVRLFFTWVGLGLGSWRQGLELGLGSGLRGRVKVGW